MRVCKGRIQCIPKHPPNKHSKYQNKEEHTHTTIQNIKKRQEYTYPKRKKIGERKNIKKNHINFSYPNKWPDSLASPMESPSITTEITTGRRTKNKI